MRSNRLQLQRPRSLLSHRPPFSSAAAAITLSWHWQHHSDSRRSTWYTVTLMSQWGLTPRRPSLPASLYCVSYEMSTGLFPAPFSCRWWRLLFRCDWTTETQPSPALRCTYSSDFSRWWTMLLGWWTHRRGTTTSLHSPSTVQVEDKVAHWFQARSPCLQDCQHRAAPSYLADELRQPADLEALRRHTFRLITVADCPPYAAVNYRRPRCHRCSCLEQPAAAHHVCNITVWLPQPPEAISL